jgi:hypothetical protein
VPSGPWALATIDTGQNDYAVTTTINLCSGSGWGTTNGWEVGPILRYRDPQRALGNRLSNGSLERPGREITSGLTRHGEAALSGCVPDGPDG